MPYLFSLSLLLAYTLTLNYENNCKCSDLVNESNCNENTGACEWNYDKYTCENVACANITIQSICTYSSDRCYWSSGQCQNFTNCASIPGTTEQECLNSNQYCPASNGNNCGTVSQMQACSSFINQTSCNSYFSQAGPCIWNGTQCVVATSCSQIYNNITNTCQYRGCYLSGSTCLPQTCSDLKNSLQCQAGILIFGPYLQNVVACQWNSLSDTCEDFDLSTVDVQQCYQNTMGTYCWSNSDSDKGSCQQCFDRLLQTILALTINLLW